MSDEPRDRTSTYRREAEDNLNSSLLSTALKQKIADIPPSLHATLCEVLKEEVQRLEGKVKDLERTVVLLEMEKRALAGRLLRR